MNGNARAIATLEKAPPLDLYETLIWGAFFDLHTERLNGTGIGSIPWSKIVGWARFYDFTQGETDALIKLIRAMDSVWIEWAGKKNKSAA